LNKGLEKTGFPVALVTDGEAPPALFDTATACTAVAAQATVEWLVEADPDLAKLLAPARKGAHERAKRIAARWYAGPSGRFVGQEPRRGCSCHVAGLWKRAQAWMPKRSGHAVNGGPEARRERPVTWQGHRRPREKPDEPVWIVPGFRGLFTDKASAKERLADGLFRQIAYRLVVLQDQNGQWSSAGNQFLSSALEALNIARMAA